MKFDEMRAKNERSRTVTVPHGWVVVPLEPTHEMIYRGHEAWKGRYGKGTDQTNEDIYKAMVNAAPKL